MGGSPCPRNYKTLDIIRKNSGKKMKKVHNTRSKDREMIATLQTTTPKEKEAEITTPSTNSSASTTGSTSSDWIEIIKHETATIELQRQHEVDDNLTKNSTGFVVEGSENLCNDQSVIMNLFSIIHLKMTSEDKFDLADLLRFTSETNLLDENLDFSKQPQIVECNGQARNLFLHVKIWDFSRNIRSNQELLSVRLRRVPITDKEVITKEIKGVFENVGDIKAIKPLLYKGTPIQSDQWVVIFDITEDSDLTQQIPRYINIMDQKVVIEWKEAPKLCFFCDGEGHIKRDCRQLRNANNLRQNYKEFKELKNKQVLREGTLENAQKTVKEKKENPYTDSSQELITQETVIVDQDINMECEKLHLDQRRHNQIYSLRRQ
ncbi:hypothetical protein C2G38_2038568 [Gigaspora rosea]|uniref:CCHC-type domain-containing protein n=1 Tax=Gigaspora rosea TaxID=44941 RepID=A0A397V219_9GLOM|nr:hypothetical protein C2G38_2038568 [Gigaspora rosea]